MSSRQEGEFREWMEVSETEDLPEGGPLAPWMKAGREPAVPTAGKVFYVNGYTFEEFRSRIGLVGNPILRKRIDEFSKQVFGTVPEGELGADFLPVPFASIPVRLESRGIARRVADYVKGVGDHADLTFMRIVAEEGFADVEKALMAHKGMPRASFDNWHILYANAYVVNRVYGGPEEGGWWYDAGFPVASFPYMNGDRNDRKAFREASEYLEGVIGWHSEFPLSSVLGADEFRIYDENFFAEPFPKDRPVYE